MRRTVLALVLGAAIGGACGSDGPSKEEVASSSASVSSATRSVSVSERNSVTASADDSRSESGFHSLATAAAEKEAVRSALQPIGNHVSRLGDLFGTFTNTTRPGPTTAATLGDAATEFAAVAEGLRGLSGGEPERSSALAAVEEAEADLRKAQALCGIEGLATLCLEPMASVNASTKLAFDRLNAFIAIAVGS